MSTNHLRNGDALPRTHTTIDATDPAPGKETTAAAPDPAQRIEAGIAELIAASGATNQKDLVRRIIRTGLGLGGDGARRLDAKIAAAAIEEMRTAFNLFAPYSGVRKATVFGSARTQRDDPLWNAAENVAATLASHDWMVVTGAGPGIMEAAATGAGVQNSLGVSIRLPFEEQPNQLITGDERSVSMKYFFTRKLMLVKESSAFICLPGGFGTLDETFELLTLQQTGKSEPVPIVLLDRPGGTFWRGFEEFVRKDIEAYGMITPGDLDRVLITDSAEAAGAEIARFWLNYDSLRWVGDRLVLRLRHTPTDAEVADLSQRFAGLTHEDGAIARTEPLPAEVRDEDRLDLPRIVLRPSRRAVGELHRIIRALADLPSAQG